MSDETGKPISIDDVMNVLKQRGVSMVCLRCGHSPIDVAGFVALESMSGSAATQGPKIPTAMLRCNNCGFLMQHGLIALGLV